LSDVSSKEECEGVAATAVGYGSANFQEIPGGSVVISCVYDTASGYVFYSSFTGAAAQPNANYQYICPGTPTTTTVTASSVTTATSTTTSVTASTITTTEGEQYSVMDAFVSCYDLGLADVLSEQECHGSAMIAAGYSGAGTSTLQGTTFKISCVYDTQSNYVIYSFATGAQTQGGGSVGSANYRFICRGIPTTSASSTTTASQTTASQTSLSTTVTTTSAVTTTVTSATSGPGYTLLPVGMTCYDVGLPDITSATECFGNAANYVGKGGLASKDFAQFQLDFSCVYSSASTNPLMFSTGTGSNSESASNWEYICSGILTTTRTSSSTSATTTTWTPTATGTSLTTTATTTTQITGTATSLTTT
jgi:hypothetical protein